MFAPDGARSPSPQPPSGPGSASIHPGTAQYHMSVSALGFLEPLSLHYRLNSTTRIPDSIYHHMLHSYEICLPRHTSLLVPPPLSRYSDDASATNASSNSLRALQSLAIVIRGETSGPVVDPTPFSTAFGPCSQLRTFKLTVPTYLEQPPMSLKIVNFNAPWHQLATLTLNSPLIPAHEYLDIIFRCTSLQQCTIECLPLIDDLARDRIIGLSHPPTTLPSLHTLRTGFEWGFEDNHRAFFRALRLPHLRKFQPNDYSHPLFWSSLPVFQPVLGDTIQELDLSGFTFPESLPETLTMVPNLEILWLGDDSHEHPRTMMRALGDGAVSPRLAALYLDFVDSPQFLLDILEARAVAARASCDIAALNVMIFLRGSTSAHPSDEARMTALTEVGMRIHLDVIDSRVR
ncbi:hypothetical protein BD779DRAFT_1093367 [Infundibulicybe gibba]|nr:hypothetical protein BD779DRAFT_1093367 [Infundibulicybe gibba]